YWLGLPSDLWRFLAAVSWIRLSFPVLLLIFMKNYFQQFIKFHVVIEGRLFELPHEVRGHAELNRHEVSRRHFAALPCGGFRLCPRGCKVVSSDGNGFRHWLGSVVSLLSGFHENMLSRPPIAR